MFVSVGLRSKEKFCGKLSNKIVQDCGSCYANRFETHTEKQFILNKEHCFTWTGGCLYLDYWT